MKRQTPLVVSSIITFILIICCIPKSPAIPDIPEEVDPKEKESEQEGDVYGAIVGRVYGYNDCRLGGVEVAYGDEKAISSKTGAFQLSNVLLPKVF